MLSNKHTLWASTSLPPLSSDCWIQKWARGLQNELDEVQLVLFQFEFSKCVEIICLLFALPFLFYHSSVANNSAFISLSKFTFSKHHRFLSLFQNCFLIFLKFLVRLDLVLMQLVFNPLAHFWIQQSMFKGGRLVAGVTDRAGVLSVYIVTLCRWHPLPVSLPWAGLDPEMSQWTPELVL